MTLEGYGAVSVPPCHRALVAYHLVTHIVVDVTATKHVNSGPGRHPERVYTRDP